MDGKLVLKIVYADTYKTVAFDADVTVAQAMVILKQKLLLGDAPPSHTTPNGLFLFADDDAQPSAASNANTNAGANSASAAALGRLGVYLPDDALLRTCGLTGKSRIEFKSKMRQLKVANIGNEMIKTSIVDETVPLGQRLAAFGLIFGLDDVIEYSLQIHRARDNKYLWLDLEKSLAEQGIGADQVVIMRKKFFVTDSFVDMHRSAALHMLYLECKFAVVSGQYLTTLEHALQFAAWQLQIKDKDYDPLVHVAGFLNLAEFLPSPHSRQQFAEEDVYKAHRKLKGLSVDELKSRYVKHCLALPTYGTTCRLVRETSAGSNLYDHELLLGIHHDALISMHPATKDVITRTPMLEMAAFTAKNRFLQCQFANARTREFMLETEEEATLFAQLLVGYTDFKRQRRREIFAQSVFSRSTPAPMPPPTPHSSSALSSSAASSSLSTASSSFSTMLRVPSGSFAPAPPSIGAGAIAPSSISAAPSSVSAPASTSSAFAFGNAPSAPPSHAHSHSRTISASTASAAALALSSASEPPALASGTPKLKFKRAPPLAGAFSLPGVSMELVSE